ncbi:glycosyltransferase family 2 protein [Pontibacter qinzhouensis]|uniref:Glycosyltransferase family 2 protein n=1 Tax=Pontibacter qinzhouensis TaxID=2603253 RepID=A0A5C8J8R3_9BACT|nr:glycosyltransferase family 2 protein [Pontibacter qinzhouensis]TXK33788.1 glycosyltransferase family 2 protein [Pontibacter qinzhouensis]
MPSPLVSIISVNYNQAAVTCDMVASLRKITYPNIEIIVVDNASPSDNPEQIVAQYPEVKLIRSAKNLGFAGGNNLGVAHAAGEFLLFLNNDTEVDPGFLEPMVHLFTQNRQAGVASPKIIYYGTDNLIQYAGSHGINPWTGRSITIGQLEQDKGQHNQGATTKLADGAAMMVPRQVIEKVGLMPELYFLYYEELDWCEMIKRAGYSCHYVASSTIYHKESVSVGKASVLKTYYMNRNRLLFIRRNISGWPFWTSMLIFLIAAIPKKMLEFGLRFEWKHLQALAKGLWWNLTNRNIYTTRHLSTTSQRQIQELTLQ